MAADDYTVDGRATRPLEDLLAPVRATAEFTGMIWLRPFVLYGTRWLDDRRLDAHVAAYRSLLIGDDLPLSA